MWAGFVVDELVRKDLESTLLLTYKIIHVSFESVNGPSIDVSLLEEYPNLVLIVIMEIILCWCDGLFLHRDG